MTLEVIQYSISSKFIMLTRVTGISDRCVRHKMPSPHLYNILLKLSSRQCGTFRHCNLVSLGSSRQETAREEDFLFRNLVGYLRFSYTNMSKEDFTVKKNKQMCTIAELNAGNC